MLSNKDSNLVIHSDRTLRRRLRGRSRSIGRRSKTIGGARANRPQRRSESPRAALSSRPQRRSHSAAAFPVFAAWRRYRLWIIGSMSAPCRGAESPHAPLLTSDTRKRPAKPSYSSSSFQDRLKKG
jgi:hypothetical protein